MGPRTLLGLVLLVSGAAARVAPDLASALASGEVREVAIHAPPGTRTSYYRLDLPGARRGAPAVGVVRWVVGPTEARGTLGAAIGGRPGLHVETETTWFAEETRVHHVERSQRSGASLVWRELGERRGRTILVTGEPRTGFRSTEPVGRDLRRRALGDLMLPLHLVERVRFGLPIRPCQRLFRPLEHASDELLARVVPVGTGRVLELHREDGGLAGRWAFEGEDLVSFQHAEHGPVARPITRLEYEALLAR